MIGRSGFLWIGLVGTLAFALGLGGCSSETQVAQNQDAVADAGEATTESSAGDGPHPGVEVYENFCFSCHAVGLSGAPKLGDAEAWAPRIAKGADLLLKTTIEGIPPAMPQRGLCMDCTDEELAAAIDYMVLQSQ